MSARSQYQRGGDVSERSRPGIVGLFMRRGCVVRMRVCLAVARRPFRTHHWG
jgi:hypothetical protein